MYLDYASLGLHRSLSATPGQPQRQLDGRTVRAGGRQFGHLTDVAGRPRRAAHPTELEVRATSTRRRDRPCAQPLSAVVIVVVVDRRPVSCDRACHQTNRRQRQTQTDPYPPASGVFDILALYKLDYYYFCPGTQFPRT